MIKYNYDYAKPDENGYPLYAPIPLVLHIPHHDEWAEDVIDQETGEPTGETEHKERDWIEDRYVQQPAAADWAQAGYLRLYYNTDPGLHEQGRHWQKTGRIVPATDHYVWEYVLVDDPPPPPRVFSKFWMELALFKAGLLPAVDAFIDSQTITNEKGETMPLRRAYSTALTFSEDNEYFASFLSAVKTTLGIDDATADAILSASVEGGA